MTKSAILTGLVMIAFGVWLFFKLMHETYWLYIYPVGIILIGIALIVFWKSEDTIEKRKDK